MSDRNVGFQFIPNPRGNAMSDSDFLARAIDQQAEHDHRDNLMLSAAVVLIICLSAFLLLKRLRSK